MSSDTTGEIFVLQRTGDQNKEGVFVLPAGAGGKQNGGGRVSGGMGLVWTVVLGLMGWLVL